MPPLIRTTANRNPLPCSAVGLGRHIATLGVFLVAIQLMGCGRGDPDYFGTIRPRHPVDEVWLNNSNEPEYLDPGKCSDSTGGEILWNIFAGLTELHPATLEPMPDIAQGWELSEDGTTYTFHLRDSVWSDGTPVTAHDFEWSWKRVLDPQTASKYATIMYPIRNADVFHSRALVLRGIPESTSEDEVKAFVEQAIPVEKIKRSGDEAFVFVRETSSDEPADDATVEVATGVTREQAVEQLDGKSLGDAAITVQLADSSVVRARAVDDHTFVVELEYPVPYFLNLTGFYTFMPVPRHLLERLKSEGKNPDLWTRTENLVNNGPYRMTEWKFRQYMLFEKNDRYWNADAPHLFRAKKIRALMIESYNTALNMYCAGEIDWLGSQAMVPSELMDRMKTYHDHDNSRYLGIYFYWFNTAIEPTDNPLVRKALSLAIDREKITSFVTRAGQIPTASAVPDGLAGYKGLDLPLFNPEAARAALAEAGYPDGKGLPQITLIYNTTEQHKQVASAAQQMWKENLGIDVRIENQEWNVYLSRLQQMDFQIARLGWIGDYADPNTFLDLFVSNNGNNHSNWRDEKFDQMLLDANKQIDKQKRLDGLRKAEAYALAQHPMLPIYVYTKPSMVKPYLGGFFGNDMDRHQWKYFYIDEDWYDGKPAEIAADPIPPVVPAVVPVSEGVN